MIATIRARLLSLVGIALLPAMAIIAYDQYLFRQQVFRQIQEDAFREVSLIAQQIDAQVRATGRQCGLVARLPGITSMDAASGAVLAELLREAPYYVNLAIADASGRIVSSALAFAGDVSVGDRTFFTRAVESRAFAVGEFYRNPISPRAGMDVGCPLLAGDGTVRGVLWASLRLDWTSDLLHAAQFKPGAVLLILDRRGTVLLRSIDPDQWVGRKADTSEMFKYTTQAGSGTTIARGVDGVKRLYAFRHVQTAQQGAGRAFGLVVVDWMLPGMNGLDAAARIRQTPGLRSLPIVLISAYAGKEEVARCAELGVNVFLPKPITASSFFDAILEAESAGARVARRPHAAPLVREYRGVRALLAEDNEANQMVAVELLSRLGIDLDIAGNGREAVEMARADPGAYVCILMDMQMPEVDGISATLMLRADAAFRDLPIIAMTANAMKADLDACLAAGMNDCITKPIDRTVLASTLRRWLPESARTPEGGGATGAPPPVRAAAPAAPPTLGGINVAGALARLGIGFDALQRMLIRFADGQAGTVAELRAAADARDADGAARHAHAIAGAAGNLGAEALGDAAKALESAARAGERDLGGLARRVEELAGVVIASIAALRPAAPSPGPMTPAAPADPAVLRRALAALREALEHGDPAATANAIAALDGLPLPEPVRAAVDKARAQADEYAFDEAGAGIGALLTHMTTEPRT